MMMRGWRKPINTAVRSEKGKVIRKRNRMAHPVARIMLLIGPARGDDGAVAARVTQVERVKLDGFTPAEANKKQHKRAERV